MLKVMPEVATRVCPASSNCEGGNRVIPIFFLFSLHLFVLYVSSLSLAIWIFTIIIILFYRILVFVNINNGN